MAEHYTKLTVETTAFCKKCRKNTQHAVMGGRLAGCKECQAKQDPPKPKPATQEKLF